LTPHRRHASLDDIDRTPDSADSAAAAAAAVAKTARRLTEEFSRPGPPQAGVAAARDLQAAAEAALQGAIDRARAAGASWRDIGDVLGTSRQAAFQRFGHPVDPRTGVPMSHEVPPGAADLAIAIFSGHSEGRFEQIRSDFDERLQQRLTADRLAAAWASVIGMFGQLEGIGEPFARRTADDTLVDVPLHFEAGDARGLVRLDADGKVAGLAIRP
jgi:Protein of unknown function (DUF3887)